MKSPKGNQLCEVCKSGDHFILLDARVKLNKYWPKGHWVYMCIPCHVSHGLGYDSDSLVVYQRFAGRYFEVHCKGEFLMGPEEIRALQQRASGGDLQSQTAVFIAEIAFQLSIVVKELKTINDFLSQKNTPSYSKVYKTEDNVSLTEIDGKDEDNV